RSNPSFLVNMKEQPILFALLKSVDVFSIWWIVLCVIGLAYVSKLSPTKVAIITLILYAFVVLLTVAAAAMQASGGAS
ncbi:MAG TPA: hypothetical protein VIL97_06575, partial [Thermoanaerobaculia bacterium]